MSQAFGIPKASKQALQSLTFIVKNTSLLAADEATQLELGRHDAAKRELADALANTRRLMQQLKQLAIQESKRGKYSPLTAYGREQRESVLRRGRDEVVTSLQRPAALLRALLQNLLNDWCLERGVKGVLIKCFLLVARAYSMLTALKAS